MPASNRHGFEAAIEQCGMPRGFLPWGLSNTGPQGGAMRAFVTSDGQVSDNPTQEPSGEKDPWRRVLSRALLTEIR